MNHDSPLSPDDPRLLAFALGEIADPAERNAIGALVAADASLAAAVEAHRAFSVELGESLAREPLPFVRPEILAAAAMGREAGESRRRGRGLGGAISGVSLYPEGNHKTVIRFGLGAAVAACVALLLTSRTEGPTSSPAPKVAESPVSDGSVAVRATAPTSSLASLAGGLPSLASADGLFRPAGRAPLALSASNARAYATAFARELAAGRRPSATHTRLDGLVNAFVGARHHPAGAAPVVVEAALTDAPWDAGRRLLRVTVRATGVTGEVVARNATASVDFDPAGVKAWRLLGYAGGESASSRVTLRGGETVTTLYEIEPVSGATVAGIAGIAVHYAPADRPGAEVAVAALTGADRRSFDETDDDTRFSAGLAAYALNLGESPAVALAACAGDDVARREFAALVR